MWTITMTFFFLGRSIYQDPYNLERVFWLMLDRDGAVVKSIMENFQQQHKHPLPEEHRRMVAMVDADANHATSRAVSGKYALSRSYRRSSQLEQSMMPASWRRWEDAGRKINTRCALTQLWQCGATTTVLWAQDSAGTALCRRLGDVIRFGRWFHLLRPNCQLTFRTMCIFYFNI